MRGWQRANPAYVWTLESMTRASFGQQSWVQSSDISICVTISMTGGPFQASNMPSLWHVAAAVPTVCLRLQKGLANLLRPPALTHAAAHSAPPLPLPCVDTSKARDSGLKVARGSVLEAAQHLVLTIECCVLHTLVSHMPSSRVVIVLHVCINMWLSSQRAYVLGSCIDCES